MEQERSNGFRRNSLQHGIYSRPVERRPSKKSSSKDRHGIVYPDTFQQGSIRTVTPDSASDAGTQSLSESDYNMPTNTSASPRSTARSKNINWDRRREFSPYLSAVDGDDPSREARSQRARSRTTTLDEQRSDISPNFLSKSRSRVGSINTTGTSSDPKASEESVGSIGYPSVVQSPTYPGQVGGRQRPSQAPSGAPAITGVSRNPAAFVSPLSNADSAKILQLMKTTCGRMHGILSFRTATNTQWTSGYCAINVATGSLIYQAKGEVAMAKTLIPDLRGCHVRTQFDTELQSTYLNVSTFSSGLGIQLKPHVNETFDSWLAALLCWQPIRPKGVQNKRTKPQSVAIGDRRLIDRRRNSESTVQKEAAIIKVGKMHLWEKPSTSGARPESGWQSSSAYKQHKSYSSAWQRVSCTLHENGHFKLFTETDVSLLAVIQLSQLSRSAIQQLEPSVLGDDYCIAIYPQYAALSVSEAASRPVFLSLETRILFEVWFVLLRAFTIPELYGPETAAGDDQSRTQNLVNPTAPSPTDMFRIERTLSVRITEARLNGASSGSDDSLKSKAPLDSTEKPLASDYYAEVLLDGETRAKTAVKHKTTNPFWREDFSFCDLPPILSNATILLKTLNPAQKDWTIIAHGPYSLDAQTNPLSALDDLELSSNDATAGRVDLRLDELEVGVNHEKWWTIIDDRDQVLGDIYMKILLQETIVLMSHEYEPMSELLHTFTNNLTINMVQIIPTELSRLSEIFLNIFQVSGQAAEWISALVEDEIDGLDRETNPIVHNRYRYATRIHSNDSKESSQDREVIVRDLGRSATVEANLLFRGNSLLTKAVDMHMRRLGSDYLQETIGARIRDLNDSDPDCEVDPLKLRQNRPEDLDRNWRNLIGLTSIFWKSISSSASRCPPELRRIFRHVRACAEDRYGDFLRSVTYSSVSGFLFLRFFCPAILNPKLFGLLKDHPRARAQRTLTLIAKALQGLANMTTFGSKEPWMEPMNKFLLSNRSAFKAFVDSICSIPAERPAQIVTPQYATPIQILGRLPATSREGFPSLPFLIDHARSFADLTKIWLRNAPEKLNESEDVDPSVAKFHALALDLQQRTLECFSKAEQAERPSGNLEMKWEELVESMDRSITFYDENSKPATPATPAVETPPTAPAVVTNHRNSIGYFSQRPSLPRRSTDTAADGDEDTPPSSSSATWEHYRLPFAVGRSSDPRESVTSSRNSSQYSLEHTEVTKSRGKESSSKLRLLDFVPGPSRRKNKDSVNKP